MPAVLLVRPIQVVTITVGIVPLLFLAYLRYEKADRDVAYWWLAAALAVSFVADVLSFIVPRRAANDAYPLLQSGLIGLVLLDRPTALLYCGALGAASILVPLAGLDKPDWLFSTVAWLSIAWIVYRYKSLPELLRLSFLLLFGVGWVCWISYVLWPGWTSWGAYQLVRASGTGLFCWAILKPTPSLRLA